MMVKSEKVEFSESHISSISGVNHPKVTETLFGLPLSNHIKCSKKQTHPIKVLHRIIWLSITHPCQFLASQSCS